MLYALLKMRCLHCLQEHTDCPRAHQFHKLDLPISWNCIIKFFRWGKLSGQNRDALAVACFHYSILSIILLITVCIAIIVQLYNMFTLDSCTLTHAKNQSNPWHSYNGLYFQYSGSTRHTKENRHTQSIRLMKFSLLKNL